LAERNDSLSPRCQRLELRAFRKMGEELIAEEARQNNCPSFSPWRS
jgi:hypothetical protein